jgi:hypothetical protein
LPTSGDLAVLSESSSVRDQLLQACIISVSINGESVAFRELPAEVQNAIIVSMEKEDPLANLGLALICPTCNYPWEIMFDILSFFWSEINAWAYRTFREVHSLASVYGWSEADILGMSSQRRQLYLKMVNG